MARIAADCTGLWKHFAVQCLVEDEDELIKFEITSYTHSANHLKGFVECLECSDHLKNISSDLEWVGTAKR